MSEGDRLGNRPSHFLSAWMSHYDFFDWTDREWSSTRDLGDSLRAFSEKLKAWNKHTFGNIFAWKKRVMSRLKGTQKSLSIRCTAGLLKLEQILRKEIKEVLFQEEILWKQKSRIEWIRKGDKSTKFFHLTTLIKRLRNKIDCLMNEDGDWVSDKEQLKDLAINYYSKLFSPEDNSWGGDYIGGLFPQLVDEQWRELAKSCESDEVWRALKSMGPLKAPGPDSFSASFFQRTWGVTGPALVGFVKQVLEKRKMPFGINDSLLVLIPMEDKLSSIKGFQPTNLCNICIKVVIKEIMNRLKGVLGDLILENQGAFVSGRQGVDNTIISKN